MRMGLQPQWMASLRPVWSQEIGLETLPERLWRRRNRPGRRATLPFEGAWEGQNRRNNSGTCRRRKVLGQGARLDTPATRRLRPLEIRLDGQPHRRHEPRVVGLLRIGHWRGGHRQTPQLFPARLQGLQSGSTIEYADYSLKDGKLKEVVEWALQGDGRGGKDGLDEEKLLIRDGELFG